MTGAHVSLPGLKQSVRDILTGVASDLLLKRIESMLDEAKDDPARMRQACAKIEKMVSLFVGQSQADAVAVRLRAAMR